VTSKFSLPKHISQLAESIVQGRSGTKTSLNEILEEEGIPLIQDNYGNSFDGMTVFDDMLYIHLNTARGNSIDSPRGRFTLAHELGHCIIENHRIGLMNGLLKPHPSKLNQSFHIQIEREADFFASCLLMPSEKFKTECMGKPFSFKLIQHISNVFTVSITAAALRFTQVGSHPIIVIYSKGNTIEWYWPSHDFPFKWLLHKKDRIPEETLMNDYFRDGTKENDTVVVSAQDWFKTYRDSDNDREFYEKCIYGPDGVLSIIWEN
jgi:Zn-dependent peptidase ImmA (M78 family)